MKKILRLTESELNNIIKESVKRILREDFNQFSDDDFASDGNPYEVGNDDVDPIADVSQLTPNDLRRVFVWDTNDSYYDFEAVYEDVSFRGSFDGDFNIEDVVIGSGGYGHQMNPNDVHTEKFEEWFNSTLGEELAKILYQKIEEGNFENENE